MPNWCYTDYVIEGDDPNEVADLYQKLESLEQMEKSPVENGFGKNYLGNVLHLFGKGWMEMDCRGLFYDLDLIDGHIRFRTETAWSDCSELWVFVCSRYKTLRHYYRAEECGCCYFVTNDADGKYFPERYEFYAMNSDCESLETKEEVLKLASEKLHRKFSSVEKVMAAIKKHNEKHPDDWMYLNEYEVVNPNNPSAEQSTDEICAP
jgi:hypothetical protein